MTQTVHSHQSCSWKKMGVQAGLHRERVPLNWVLNSARTHLGWQHCLQLYVLGAARLKGGVSGGGFVCIYGMSLVMRMIKH